MPANFSFSDWVGAPRDFETISRSLQRKIFGPDNRSSYPLLSGNTFASICAINLDDEFAKPNFNLGTLQSYEGRMFLRAGSSAGNTQKLFLACATGIRFPHAELIIHNGDVIPTETEMKIISSSFRTVYSVNWLGESAVAQPIPIGLENRDKRRNGVPSDFLKEIRLGLPSQDLRDIRLLACFSLHTNFNERSKALEKAREVSGVKIVTDPITPKQYRKLLLRSKFVLSPPGNGPDCHRTWEALYLGATPIVLRSSWPFLKHRIPILVVDDWSQLDRALSQPVLNNTPLWDNLDFWIPS